MTTTQVTVPPFIVPQKMTWDNVGEEIQQICSAWNEDHGEAIMEHAKRLQVGWQRYIDALRSGDVAGASVVLTKIRTVEEKIHEFDALNRRLCVLKGLMVMRALAGISGVKVAVRTAEASINVE